MSEAGKIIGAFARGLARGLTFGLYNPKPATPQTKAKPVASISLTKAITYRNVRAFLWALRFGEGTQVKDGYRVMFGGGKFAGPDGKPDTFDDFADHPRKVITRTFRNGKTVSSTAAGAYQFLSRTWDDVVKSTGFADFSPENQDLGAVFLIRRRGALEDVIAGRIDEAVAKCAREWASLPGSPYGQPTITLEQFKRHYVDAGGAFRPEDEAVPQPPPPAPHVEPTLEPPAPSTVPPPIPPAPRPRPSPAPIQKPIPNPVPPRTVGGKIMALPAALLGYILPSLIQLVPQLGKIFGNGSEVRERNVAAATTVLEIAKSAVNAHNEQEVLERIESDPDAANAIRNAIVENWFRIEEVGQGGIAGAREFNLKAAKLGVPIWNQPAFIVSMALLIPVWFIVGVVLWPTIENPFSDEIRLVVVTAIISGALSAVTGFWLGASFSQGQRQTTEL